jgi:hypothetical protein
VVLPKKVVICQCCWLSWPMLRRKCRGLTLVDTVLKDGPQKRVLKVLRMEKIWKKRPFSCKHVAWYGREFLWGLDSTFLIG